MTENGVNRRYEREPAKRVFAAELREATHSFKDGTEDFSPTYVLLPTGERCHRVFLAGDLLEKTKSDGENVFYKVKIRDPTGNFFISAGNYQQEAMHQIAGIETPAIVAVIGKPNIFNSPDGRTLISVRAESVTVVDRLVKDCWILDAAELTLNRLDATDNTPDQQKAKEMYTQTTDVWKQMVNGALATIQI